MLTVEMVSLLWCPSCRAGVLKAEIAEQQGERIQEGALICSSCQVSHPVLAGVPDLVPKGILETPEWQAWVDHLEGFQARRALRRAKSEKVLHKVAKQARKHGRRRKGSEFTSIRDGALLDVGCGPGYFRRRCDEEEVTYYGLDPQPLPAVDDFRFVRALAEYIPFRDRTFSHVVVRAALDHFQNVEGFLEEAVRVLEPGGMLHIAQTIHDVTGPVTAFKAFLHWTKDLLEDSLTDSTSEDVPHHMTEFKRSALYETLKSRFSVVAEQKYSQRWYSPDNLLLSLVPHSTTSVRPEPPSSGS